MSISELHALAIQAQATYANLNANEFGTQLANNLASQQEVGFVDALAQQFAAKYSVVLQYDDTSPQGNDTGLSLTVFKDNATNQLTLAIRGTTDAPDVATGLSILANGAGYDQITALYNGWLRASAATDSPVWQYVVSTSNEGDPSALQIPGGYLVRKANAAATGDLYGALSADPDHRIDVTGHSLGGHLAMAFAALFGASTASVATFNAPGFGDHFANRAFFEALGGVLPAQASIGAITTNVIANEAPTASLAFSPIADLGNQPGTRVEVPIENQELPGEPAPVGSAKHSLRVLSDGLADALAVYGSLDKLSWGFSTAAFDTALKSASNKEFNHWVTQ